ncbi:hypothetical protein CYY_001761 [Polysphondylium violaceum]|uniref:AB hydrolase-1 domain-containing protein n=1 Tax=Polysphondylium violaceum TaxID=133409 RepID=A0A8J4PXS6_9MYCE|nr:hypothetical protein CYY_001761 [Polysphondylium violaceum]
MKAEELSIPIGTGITIASKAWGNPHSSHRVLALHGWLDNANSFDSIGPVLAEAGIRVVCIDFIGHGLSPHKPQWCNLYYTDYITQVLDVVEALSWKTFTLMGHSMGAGISSILAAIVPHMIERVICLDFIGILSKEQDQVKAIQFAIQNRETINNRKPPLYANKQAIFDKLKSNNPWIADHAAHRLLERSTECIVSPNGEQMYKLRHDKRLVGPSIFIMREAEVLIMLEEIKCPVFLIWGTVSAQQFAIKRNWTEIMEKRMQCVKNLRQVVVDGSHHFHMENIDAFSKDLIEFILEQEGNMTFSPDPNLKNTSQQQPDNHNQIAEESERQEKKQTSKLYSFFLNKDE